MPRGKYGLAPIRGFRVIAVIRDYSTIIISQVVTALRSYMVIICSLVIIRVLLISIRRISMLFLSRRLFAVSTLEVGNKTVNIGEEINGQVILNNNLFYTKEIELNNRNRDFSLTF